MTRRCSYFSYGALYITFVLATSTVFPHLEPKARVPMSYDNALIFCSSIRVLTVHKLKDPWNGISHGSEILSYSLDAAGRMSRFRLEYQLWAMNASGLARITSTRTSGQHQPPVLWNNQILPRRYQPLIFEYGTQHRWWVVDSWGCLAGSNTIPSSLPLCEASQGSFVLKWR